MEHNTRLQVSDTLMTHNDNSFQDLRRHFSFSQHMAFCSVNYDSSEIPKSTIISPFKAVQCKYIIYINEITTPTEISSLEC